MPTKCKISWSGDISIARNRRKKQGKAYREKKGGEAHSAPRMEDLAFVPAKQGLMLLNIT